MHKTPSPSLRASLRGTVFVLLVATSLAGCSGADEGAEEVAGNAQALMPPLKILHPADGARFPAGRVSVPLIAEAPEESREAVQWSSSLDGPIATGHSAATASLSVGEHVLTARLVTTETLEQTVRITVFQEAPEAEILFPAPGDAPYPGGAAVEMRARAVDYSQPINPDYHLPSFVVPPVLVEWSSDRDGRLGTGNPAYFVLSPGTHTLSVTTRNAAGEATDSVEVTVAPAEADRAPTVNILAPDPAPQHHSWPNDASNDRGEHCREFQFRGTGADPEDGVLAPERLAWTTSRDDGPFRPLGTGTDFRASLCSVDEGSKHVVRLVATDSAGMLSAPRHLVVYVTTLH